MDIGKEEASALAMESDSIRSRIFTIRGVQVMLDRDLAKLYEVPTGRLNEQVKRNIRRFPENFMFQLTREELKNWISQFATSNLQQSVKMGIRTRPFAFTEYGIIMLAGVLKSNTAIDVSIKITSAFVTMRKALTSIAPMMARIRETERLQLEEKTARLADQKRNEERFEVIFKSMDEKEFPPQKIFYDGQIYDAFEQMKHFVQMARQELIVIDPFFDDSVLPLIAQKQQGVAVLVVKNARKDLLHAVDVARFNAQYGNSLTVKESSRFHDRFLIIDRSTLIHVGASFNYLGKRCFAFSSMDKSNIPDILAKI